VRGDVVQRVDDAGVVLRNYRYTAFGVELEPCDDNTSPGGVNLTNPFRFGGMYWDWATSTYMTPNRHFSPRLGRWTQPDPFWNTGNMQGSNAAIAQSGNLYMFTMHNPVMWTDPTGLFAVPAFWRHFIANSEAQSDSADGVRRSLPKGGPPYEVLPNPDGTAKQERWRTREGEPVRDRDWNHPDDDGTHDFPHDHIWEDGRRVKKPVPAGSPHPQGFPQGASPPNQVTRPNGATGPNGVQGPPPPSPSISAPPIIPPIIVTPLIPPGAASGIHATTGWFPLIIPTMMLDSWRNFTNQLINNSTESPRA